MFNTLLLIITIYIGNVACLILRLFFSIHTPKKSKKTVAFFAMFYPDNAGYHYRVRLWADILEQNGYAVKILQVYDKQDVDNLALENFKPFLLKAIFIRIKQVLLSVKYEKIIVRRELLLYNDYGNLFMDRLLLTIHPNAILDFDDNISAAKGEPRVITSILGKILLEDGIKFLSTLKLYSNFIAGSEYLKQLVLKHNEKANIIVIPTCVDYEKYSVKDYSCISTKQTITVGWIGSNGNQQYLDTLINDLNIVHNKHPVKLFIISGKKYESESAKFKIINCKWSIKDEIDNMLNFDIGIMPIPDSIITRGKCGFKLIQYMGLGIVSVASSVGVNSEIVEDNNNGFLVSASQTWGEVITKVILEKNKMKEYGLLARMKIMEKYSFKSNEHNYLDFLESK